MCFLPYAGWLVRKNERAYSLNKNVNIATTKGWQARTLPILPFWNMTFPTSKIKHLVVHILPD